MRTLEEIERNKYVPQRSQIVFRDGYDPPGNVEDKACDSAATFTHTASDYTLNKNLTIYVPDGVEGYFPYTIVASASS